MIDLDNTLVDRAAAVDEWAHEFVAEHGLPADAVGHIIELDRDGYSDRQTVFSAIRRWFDLQAPIDDLLAAYRTRVIELTRLADGALQSLAAMRARDWAVVIVTNGSSGQQHAKIAATGLRNLVDGVVVSGDLDIAKPDRRIFDIAAESVGRTAEASWMVGDSAANDILGPAAIGMRTAWLDRGRCWTDLDASPDVTVSSLTDLVGAIESAER